ncbi:MAG: metal-dependent transcriptional regulator [Chloroflexi bacterium]|jgi:DtxR family Mn-dependent transcriptional regulator|nr:metal-dependent transcriptional regulator [Chloroflexota bacterium]
MSAQKSTVGPNPSESVENFLKAVYTLQHVSERVSTNALAERLNVTAPSVTDMAQRLEDAGLLNYQKYYGMRLTDEGERVALSVIRRHRLIELFLVRELGYDLHEVHDEAERLEHAVSDRFVEAIDRKLGTPDIDPHGDPIPTAEGTVATVSALRLTQLTPGTTGIVVRLDGGSAEILRHLTAREIRLGDEIQLISCSEDDDTLEVVIGGRSEIIARAIASSIYVDSDVS